MALLLNNQDTMGGNMNLNGVYPVALHLNTGMKLSSTENGELSPSLPTSPSAIPASVVVDLGFKQVDSVSSKRMFWLEDHNAECEKEKEQRDRSAQEDEQASHEYVEETPAVAVATETKRRSAECIRISNLVNALNANYGKFLESLAASQGQPLLSSPALQEH